MTATFRMDRKLEEMLDSAAEICGKGRSQIIREAIAHYCQQVLDNNNKSWYDVVSQSGFRPGRSGMKDLASNKSLLRSAIVGRAKRCSN